MCMCEWIYKCIHLIESDNSINLINLHWFSYVMAFPYTPIMKSFFIARSTRNTTERAYNGKNVAGSHL